MGQFLLSTFCLFSMFLISRQDSSHSNEADDAVINGVHYEKDAAGPYMYCYNINMNETCNADSENCTNVATSTKCRLEATDHQLYCFYVIPIDHGVMNKAKGIKGCFSQSPRGHSYCNNHECVGKPKRPGGASHSYFCCCNTSHCNHEMTSFDNGTNAESPEDNYSAEEDLSSYLQLPYIIVLAVIAVLATVVLVSICWWYYKRRSRSVRRARPGATSTPPLDDVEQLLIVGNSQESLNIVQMEAIGKGRFGEVYRGLSGDAFVAVKIFPRIEMHSWKAEKDIYHVEGLQDHENILRYVGSEMHGAFFWLVTEYHEKGSLFQYLRNNVLSLLDAMKIINSTLCGLAFLHEEKFLEHGVKKPCVVHRDFKSRNVLLKNDLTGVVADFGLALICENGKSPAEGTRGQVGTKRYMSPEVLEGATEFSAFAFRQIDVYAAALVLWEILKRTVINDDDEAEQYRMPFEDELGKDPTIHELRTAVVKDKLRPLIRKSVFSSKIGCSLWKMIEEMWNAEPDGRITAGCALERVKRLYNALTVENQSTSAPSADEAALSSMYNVREEDPLMPKNEINELDFHQMYAPPNQHADVIPSLLENLYPLIRNGYNQSNLVHPVGAALKN